MDTDERSLYRAIEKNSGGRMVFRFEPGMPIGVPDLGLLLENTYNPSRIISENTYNPSRFGHSWVWVEAKWESPVVRPEQAIMLRKLWTGGSGAFIFARWRGDFYLVPGGSISLDTRIRYDEHLARWKDEVCWEEFWDIVLKANY